MLAAGDKDAAALHGPSVQTLSGEGLAALRAQRLEAVRDRLASARGSRYGTARRRWQEHPRLTGAELAAEVEAHPPFGRFQLVAEPLIRAGLATAAVPRPTPIAWTRADLDAEAQLGARAFRRSGLAARGRSSDCLEGGLITPGTLAVGDALDALDALALPVGPITSASALQRAAEVWDIVRPQVLVVDAPSLAFLYAADGYPRPRSFALLLTPADAAELAAPARADVCRIFSLPQVCSFVAGECSARDGYHVAEDAVLAEIEDGCLLLTALARSLTLVRFDTGLRAELDRTPCACGEAHARLRFLPQ